MTTWISLAFCMGAFVGYSFASFWYNGRVRALYKEAMRLEEVTHGFVMDVADVMLNGDQIARKSEILDLCEKYLGESTGQR